MRQKVNKFDPLGEAHRCNTLLEWSTCQRRMLVGVVSLPLRSAHRWEFPIRVAPVSCICVRSALPCGCVARQLALRPLRRCLPAFVAPFGVPFGQAPSSLPFLQPAYEVRSVVWLALAWTVGLPRLGSVYDRMCPAPTRAPLRLMLAFPCPPRVQGSRLVEPAVAVRGRRAVWGAPRRRRRRSRLPLRRRTSLRFERYSRPCDPVARLADARWTRCPGPARVLVGVARLDSPPLLRGVCRVLACPSAPVPPCFAFPRAFFPAP